MQQSKVHRKSINMARLLVFLVLIKEINGITFRTFNTRAECPDGDATSSTEIASKYCIAGTGKWASSEYSCREKKVMITTYKNSKDCALTPNNTTIVKISEISAMDKCIKLGKGWVFYDCSNSNSIAPSTMNVFLLLSVIIMLCSL